MDRVTSRTGKSPKAKVNNRDKTAQASVSKKNKSSQTNKVSAAAKTSSQSRVHSNKSPSHQFKDAVEISESAEIRLNKLLASAGVASRRATEILIDEGRVEVDGTIVRTQGVKVNPQEAVIKVDGRRVIVRNDMVYLSLNKPFGWQSTMQDQQGRPCVGDIIREKASANGRLFHVGRLDADTEGLLLLTNDGELAHRLMHPSYNVTKTYLVQVQGSITKTAIKELTTGMELDDGHAIVDNLDVIARTDNQTQIIIKIHEGRKRIIRRMFSAVGFPVTGLVRTHIDSIALGNQRPGSIRVLNNKEIAALYNAVGL